MKNFTNNFKQITSRLSARWLIMALMLLLGTSSAWGGVQFTNDYIFLDLSGSQSEWEKDGAVFQVALNEWDHCGNGWNSANETGHLSKKYDLIETSEGSHIYYANVSDDNKSRYGAYFYRCNPSDKSVWNTACIGYNNSTHNCFKVDGWTSSTSTYNLTGIYCISAPTFGEVEVGQSATSSGTYLYAGVNTIPEISNNTAEFQYVGGSSSITTNGLSTITVKFTPSSAGDKTGTLKFGDYLTTSLSGKGKVSCIPPILTLTTPSATVNKGETINLTTLSGSSASDGGVIEWSVNTSGDPVTSEEQTINSTKKYWARAVGDCRSAAQGFTVNVACEKDFYLVGSSADIFGEEWSPGLVNNKMNCDLNVRTKTYTNVNLKAGTYSYKYTSGQNWNDEYPSGNNNNKTFTIDADGIYNITFTANGTSTSITSSEVTITPACTPSATITDATYSCYGNTIHLEGSLTEACGGMYYGWQYKTTAGDDWSTATAIAGHATYNYSESATTYELDWTIPNQGYTYYFRAYATLDAKVWYSDGKIITVTTYAEATLYTVTGNENTLTLSGSQTGYTYTLYDTDGAVAESSKTGTGNSLTWNLSGVSTFYVKVRPTGSTCDEVEMDGNYTNRIEPISNVTLDYCNEKGEDIGDPNPMCKGAIAYVKLAYNRGSTYSDIRWLIEGVQTDKVKEVGNGVWGYEILGTGQLSVELRNDANKDNEDNPTWATSNKLPFTMKAEPAAPYISIDPASGIICEGSSATITVENANPNCSYKLVEEEEDPEAEFTQYVSGDHLKYTVQNVAKYYVVAQHNECHDNQYTSNQVAINQIISTSAKISIKPTSAETTPWEKVSIEVIYDEGYGYDLTYPNGLDNVENVIIEQVGDTYTYSIPRPWTTGDANPRRASISYQIKAKLKVDGEATQCNNMSEASTTITLKDEDNENCPK